MGRHGEMGDSMQVPVQGKDRDPHSILNKLYVVHQLIAVEEKCSDNFKDGFFVHFKPGERRDGVKEELGAELEVPHRHRIQPLIHLAVIQSLMFGFVSYLESVPPVPVPSLLQHLLRLGDVGRRDGVVIVEKSDADVEKHQVHTVAKTHL